MPMKRGPKPRRPPPMLAIIHIDVEDPAARDRIAQLLSALMGGTPAAEPPAKRSYNRRAPYIPRKKRKLRAVPEE